MLSASVRSSNIHGWIIEVHDSSLPWGHTRVREFRQLKRPTMKDKAGAVLLASGAGSPSTAEES